MYQTKKNGSTEHSKRNKTVTEKVVTTCTEEGHRQTTKSGYNMYRGWTQTDYQNKHYNINQKDEVTQDDRGRDGGASFILTIKEHETNLTLQEHDDDGNDHDHG